MRRLSSEKTRKQKRKAEDGREEGSSEKKEDGKNLVEREKKKKRLLPRVKVQGPWTGIEGHRTRKSGEEDRDGL